MKFSELDCCPFCGYDEYYTTSYVRGTVTRFERYDGKETYNGEMYATGCIFTMMNRKVLRFTL